MIVGLTVKYDVLVTVFDGVPPLMTEILPRTASPGTLASIRVSETTRKLADTVPNLTEETFEKAVPVITTVVPTVPLVGEKPVIEKAMTRKTPRSASTCKALNPVVDEGSGP